MPTDGDRQAFSDAYKECVAAIRSSTDNYDKNLITISSAFIGIPFAFIGKLNSGKPLVGPINFDCAAGLFVVTILLVILSFQLGAKVNRCQIPILQAYYLKGDDKAITKKSRWSIALTIVNAGSGISFLSAVILTALFVYRNMENFS